MIVTKRQIKQRLGFSLVEVLLAIFILGIGIISIVSLFPAGIAMQRLSVDDTIGPTVAQNAIATIRTRVSPEDFGILEDFGFSTSTIHGDFGWSRPAFFRADTTLTGGTFVPAGSISLFNSTLPNTTDGEIPWNQAKYGNGNFNDGPVIIIPQSERYYPMRTSDPTYNTRNPRPEYVWDCMFRRFQGKIMVAIFVYRATIVGGGSFSYSASFNASNDIPLLPIALDLTSNDALALFPYGPWDAPVNTNALIDGTKADTVYDTTDQIQSWQEPGQWILDQNNNLHRVMSRTRNSISNPVEVELVRQPTQMLDIPIYFFPGNVADIDNDGLLDIHIISNIFYIPREVTINNLPVRLTPVYVTVREL